MKVVLITPASDEQVAAIAAIDPRLEIEQAWELFGPEIVAEWPAHTVEWYVPRRFRTMADTSELREQRDALLREAEVLCISFPFPLRLVSRAPKLRYVHQIPAGVSNLTRGDLWGSGVTVTSGRGANRALPIAEWVIATALALCKELPRAFRQQAAGAFDRSTFRSRGVAGKTIGIVGLGGIGQQVARLARGLDMRVIGSRRSAEPVEHVEKLYGPDELHALLGASHIVVVGAQLTPETHHLIDAAALAAMRPGAFLINVTRGELIDETALLDVLGSGHLGGFAGDVYEGEFERQPPAELLALDNVIMTPHTSNQSEQPATESMDIFRENLRRFLAGEPLINQVDWERGY